MVSCLYALNALTDISVNSPMVVTHSIVLEVYYSVYGEDVMSNKLPTPGHGQLRLLKVDKPVTIPSCAFIPEVVELPSCEPPFTIVC